VIEPPVPRSVVVAVEVCLDAVAVAVHVVPRVVVITIATGIVM
jgi:hypothetical protein